MRRKVLIYRYEGRNKLFSNNKSPSVPWLLSDENFMALFKYTFKENIFGLRRHMVGPTMANLVSSQ